MCMTFAATYPARTSALILYRHLREDGACTGLSHLAPRARVRDRKIPRARRSRLGHGRAISAELFAPSRAFG